MKEGFIIKPLCNKQDAEYLRSIELGRYVINGHGTYSKYYIEECPKVLKALAEYRKDHIKVVKSN